MIPEIKFKVEGDRLVIRDLPPGLHLRRITYPSKNLATLKRLSVASINIQAAKFYMDAIRTPDKTVSAQYFDAALVAAIIKYGSVFKTGSDGQKIDAKKIFAGKIYIMNKSISEQMIEIDDPQGSFLRSHINFIRVRDQFIAHDDRIIGHTECFAMLDDALHCENVFVLSQRTTVFSAIKEDRTRLPMCIDAAFTWLAAQKELYCQIVNDEINALKLKVRRSFPDATFENYKGLSDADERKSRSDPYWKFDWQSGEMKIVDID